MTTIFQKIINKEITAEFLHEDDICIGIMDIDPKAPFHALIIPKQLIARIGVAEESEKQILGHLLLTAKKIASEHDLNEGFRIVINNGPDGGETVPHLHVHLLGGRKLTWPPG
ncbi:MAG: histidine triad nucleotide-binding protein [Opitutae bacterium]|nr:histidine triad nucleotide-binding protein [Opitutae bacterium]|tara:strand:- start:19 stop:357 length:339 start_codon:yes stop_codon:yes gene_type:complete